MRSLAFSCRFFIGEPVELADHLLLFGEQWPFSPFTHVGNAETVMSGLSNAEKMFPYYPDLAARGDECSPGGPSLNGSGSKFGITMSAESCCSERRSPPPRWSTGPINPLWGNVVQPQSCPKSFTNFRADSKELLSSSSTTLLRQSFENFVRILDREPAPESQSATRNSDRGNIVPSLTVQDNANISPAMRRAIRSIRAQHSAQPCDSDGSAATQGQSLVWVGSHGLGPRPCEASTPPSAASAHAHGGAARAAHKGEDRPAAAPSVRPASALLNGCSAGAAAVAAAVAARRAPHTDRGRDRFAVRAASPARTVSASPGPRIDPLFSSISSHRPASPQRSALACEVEGSLLTALSRSPSSRSALLPTGLEGEFVTMKDTLNPADGVRVRHSLYTHARTHATPSPSN